MADDCNFGCFTGDLVLLLILDLSGFLSLIFNFWLKTVILGHMQIVWLFVAHGCDFGSSAVILSLATNFGSFSD